MPAKPYQEYAPGFDPLGDAQKFLRRGDPFGNVESGSDSTADDPSPRPELKPDDSLWGKIKRVAGASAIPEDIGDRFANTVDNPNDRGSGWGSVVKSGVAGGVGGLMNWVRQQATPAGLATTGLNEFVPGGDVGKLGGLFRLLNGAGSAVFAGEGAETAHNATNAGDAAKGLAGMFMGAAGLHGAVTGPESLRSWADGPRNIHKGRFSKPYSEADSFNGEPPPPPPPGPTRHPNDLFDTPGFKEPVAPVASPVASPTGTIAPEAWGDWGGAEKDMPTLGLDESGSTVAQEPAQSSLAKLLKPRASAATTEAARLAGRPVLSPETAIDARAFESGKGEYGASPEEAGRAQLLHRELTHMDDRWNHLTADDARPGPDSGAPVPESAPGSPPDLSTLSNEELGIGRHFPGDAATDVSHDAPIDLNQAATNTASDMATPVRDPVVDQIANMGREPAVDPQIAIDARSRELANSLTPRQSASSSPLADMLRASLRDQESKLPVVDAEPLPDVGPLSERFRQEHGDGGNNFLFGRKGGTLNNERGEVDLSAGLSKLRGQVTAPIDPVAAANLATKVQQMQAGSLLSSPTTIGKIGIGNTVSALQKAAEYAADQHSMAPIKNLLAELFNVKKMGAAATEAFKNPDTKHTRLDPGTALPSTGLRGLMSLGPRAVGAMDAPFRNAMEGAGFSSEDALRVTQQQMPESALGRSLIGVQSTPTGRLIVPFLKSKVNQFEQGIVEPIKAIDRIRTGAGKPSDFVKILSAVGFGAAAYESADQIDKLPMWARPLAMSAAGFAAPPAAIGYAMAHAPDQVKAIWDATVHEAPLGEGILPKSANLGQSLASRVIPRVLNPDYWTGTKRDTSGGFLDQVQAGVPGLAQLLGTQKEPRTPRASRGSVRAKRAS